MYISFNDMIYSGFRKIQQQMRSCGRVRLRISHSEGKKEKRFSPRPSFCIHPQSPSFSPRNRPHAYAKTLRLRVSFPFPSLSPYESRIAGSSEDIFFFCRQSSTSALQRRVMVFMTQMTTTIKTTMKVGYFMGHAICWGFTKIMKYEFSFVVCIRKERL